MKSMKSESEMGVPAKRHQQTIDNHYICSNPHCKAEAVWRTWEGEQAPLWINCWKCHAGLRMSPDKMAETRTGMCAIDRVAAVIRSGKGGS